MCIIVAVYTKTIRTGQTNTNDGVRLILERVIEGDAANADVRACKEYIKVPEPITMIKGLTLIDRDNGESEAAVVSGGVGFSFALIKIMNGNSRGWNYKVEVFA